jgi:DNA-directed RNA polymerase specialized sigma24 family protein
VVGVGDRAKVEVERRAALAWPHKDALQATAAGWLRLPRDAEDAAVEAIARYLAHPRAVKRKVRPAKVRPFLFGILWRVCREMNRAVPPSDVLAKVGAQEGVPAPDVSDAVVERAGFAPALARWRRLSPTHQAALAYDAEGLTLAESARRQGVCVGTAASRLKAARRTMRRVAAPVAALLSLRGARQRRAALATVGVAAVALIPATLVLRSPTSPTAAANGTTPIVAPGPAHVRARTSTGATGGAPTPPTTSVEPSPQPTTSPTPSPRNDRTSADGRREFGKHAGGWKPAPSATSDPLTVVLACITRTPDVTPQHIGCRT